MWKKNMKPKKRHCHGCVAAVGRMSAERRTSQNIQRRLGGVQNIINILLFLKFIQYKSVSHVSQQLHQFTI
mgnify:FL=1